MISTAGGFNFLVDKTTVLRFPGYWFRRWFFPLGMQTVFGLIDAVLVWNDRSKQRIDESRNQSRTGK
jgi:hypothetical protein